MGRVRVATRIRLILKINLLNFQNDVWRDWGRRIRYVDACVSDALFDWAMNAHDREQLTSLRQVRGGCECEADFAPRNAGRIGWCSGRGLVQSSL